MDTYKKKNNSEGSIDFQSMSAESFWEHANKILKPSQKKLSPDALRISDVVKHCNSLVEIVAMLPAILDNLERLSNSLPKELSEALRGQKRLTERLERLYCLNPPSELATEVDIPKLRRELQNSLRDVLRLFRAHPGALCVLRAEAERAGGQSENMQSLIGGMRGLHRILVERMLTSLAEEREQSRYMQEVSRRHDITKKLVVSLEAEIAAAVKYRDAEVSKKDAVIAKLKSSLHQMKKLSEEFLLQTQQDADNHCQSDIKTSEERETCMQQEINRLKSQLNNLTLENWEAEAALRKKKYKVETEIENWIQKYDADMGEKQDELEDIEAEYEKEKQEVRELEETYAMLEVENNQVQEEHRVAEERRREEQRVLGLKTNGAIVIQAWWRGYCVRKAMKSKKGKKGKGKKGKGKKGK